MILDFAIQKCLAYAEAFKCGVSSTFPFTYVQYYIYPCLPEYEYIKLATGIELIYLCFIYVHYTDISL